MDIYGLELFESGAVFDLGVLCFIEEGGSEASDDGLSVTVSTAKSDIYMFG